MNMVFALIAGRVAHAAEARASAVQT
jgi:hypothetical protein